jgi:hypothetical protein
MSNDEVKSLNGLAMAHGGQLTINPQTGLPEAGFLSSILPMVAGIGLNMAFPGLGAMGAGLLTGGITGIATGSLSKGLMAGLGAYGGAGLGGALAQSGMQAAASAAPEVAAASQAAYAPTLANAQSYQMAAQPGFVGPQIAPEMYAANQVAAQTPITAAREAALAGQQATFNTGSFGDKLKTLGQGFSSLGSKEGLTGFMDNAGGGMGLAKYGLAAASPLISEMGNKEQPKPVEDKDMGQRYTYSPNMVQGPYTASPTGVEQRYFNPAYTPISADKAKGIYGFAEGGVATATPMPGDRPSYQYDPMTQLFAKIESMPSDDEKKQQAQVQMQGGNVPAPPAGDPANAPTPGEAAASKAMMVPNIANFLMPTPLKVLMAILGQPAIGSTASGVMGLTGSPMSGIASKGNVGQVANAVTTANNAAAAGGRGGSGNVGTGSGSTASGQGTGIGGLGSSGGGLREGGLSETYNLGGYSDGGRLLRGPGDGVSDSIPATIGRKQPARLADGEFVVPARIVSELGNGSTEAGARKLYAMMDRVQSARSKTVGKGKIAKNSRSEKYLPA